MQAAVKNTSKELWELQQGKVKPRASATHDHLLKPVLEWGRGYAVAIVRASDLLSSLFRVIRPIGHSSKKKNH